MPEFLSFRAEVWNAFETELLETVSTACTPKEISNGQFEIVSRAHFKNRKVGVYQIVFTVLYGENEYRKIKHAFEVFDPDSGLCPPLESGLPFMFSMNNEQKKLARNSFDLWNPMPSCDAGHYYACVSNTPVEAEEREVWRYTKMFGRTWFAWLAIRTCNDYLSPKHDQTIRNADYLFHTGVNTDCDPLGAYSLFPNRVDHWNGWFYHYPAVKELLEDFLREHPEYPVSYKIGADQVTEENYLEFVRVCGEELMEYINQRLDELVKKHNRELREKNPNVKRAIYGPLPQYNHSTMSYDALKYFGFPMNEDLCREYYDGFAVFEDYPFSCSYQTYRGAFTTMTVLLYFPALAIYPELYTGSRGGSIDGAVKYAHAPMGDSKGCFVVGKLIRKAITQLVKTLSDPCAVGDGVGITLFEDEHGKRMLLAIDYSPFDNQERTAHEVSVRLFMPDVYNVKSEQEIKSVKVDGIVRELRFDILPHGFCFVELE